MRGSRFWLKYGVLAVWFWGSSRPLRPCCRDRALQAGFKLSRFGSSLNVSASFSGAMSIKGFPFLKLTVLSGSLSLNPGPPLSVTAARLRVNGTLVTTRITSDMHYDAARGVFGMQTTVDNFSLQVSAASSRANSPIPMVPMLPAGNRAVCSLAGLALLQNAQLRRQSSQPRCVQDTLGALGIDVNLGIANVAIRNARVAYAAVDINSDLQAGMHVRGQFSLFGLRAAVAFSMDSNNGVRLATSLDFSQAGRCCGWNVCTPAHASELHALLDSCC